MGQTIGQLDDILENELLREILKQIVEEVLERLKGQEIKKEELESAALKIKTCTCIQPVSKK